MRNLKIVKAYEWRTYHELPLTATAWDTSSTSIVCAFGPTSNKSIIELKRKRTLQDTGSDNVNQDVFESITSWDAPCPLPDLDCDEVLLLQYFPDTATACLVLAGGDLVLVREKPSLEEEKIEIVGSVDVGIAAVQWSPDQQLLAILTRADTLILMSRAFEVVDQATLTPEDLKASKHVSVGWGKKETQFQGKRARALRDPTIPEKVDQGKPSDNDDHRASVAWRGDGAFLAINSIVPNQRRVIRTFTREAVLDSASEPVDGLESALTWRPYGNLIAGIQRLKDRVDVVFFERNGLRHGEFSLRLSADEMKSWASSISISWNTDSSVLAVAFRDRVQFWTMGNYHYYLKQVVFVDVSPHSPRTLAIRWHGERPMACCISSLSSMCDMEQRFDICRGSVTPPDDHGIVAVVDGKTLKLTPFKHAGVPPPMAFASIAAGSDIIDCIISRDGRKVILLATNAVKIYGWNYVPLTVKKGALNASSDYSTFKPGTELHQLVSYKLHNSAGPDTDLRYRQIAICGHKVHVLGYSIESQRSVLQSIDLQNCSGLDGTDPIAVAQNLDSRFDMSDVLCLDIDQTTVWAKASTGAFALDTTLQVDLGALHQNLAFVESSLFRVPSDCNRCEEAGLEPGEAGGSGQTCPHFYQVASSADGFLYVGSRKIAQDCTSYLLTNAYLVFTTSEHLLKLAHLTDPELMVVPADTPEVDERCRRIERGAKLVTAIPSSYSVVLQMPRGNLETIHPRVLVLSGIRQHIIHEDYRAAFLACQTHQVDLNILCDYQHEVFMDKIPSFIARLKKVSRIDEFLSKLKDEDVSQTLYRDTLGPAAAADVHDARQEYRAKHTSTPNTSVSAGKVNRICNAMISHLSSRPEQHLRNIITAHVCKRPPDPRAALTLISQLRQTSPTKAEDAISHLCFLTDTNRLYDAALSLYDLQLTLMVAQNSQRDPREYLPFLQSLHSLPELRRNYTVDNHLKNYSKALDHLHALSDHSAVETYTTKHTLYQQALSLYRYDQEHLRSISTLYAQHLASTSQHSAAATLYESLGDHTNAYPLYALAHRWRESLTSATLVPLPRDQLRNHAQSLATTLTEETRDYRAAATIYTDYLGDNATAARQLCKSSYFAEATRVLSHHNLSNAIPEIIDPGLSDKFGEILQLLSDCRSQLHAQIPRILDLRKKKAEDPLGFFGGNPSNDTEGQAGGGGGGGGDDNIIPDDISLAATDASTAGAKSLFTRYGSHASTRFGGTVTSSKTHQTSRTKRREERKRARGKKGSVYEEEYLVGSVRRLVDRVNGIHDEVARLLDALVRRSLEGRERAGVLSDRMVEVVHACELGVGEVWESREREVVGPSVVVVVDDAAADARPSGADGVLWDAQHGMEALGLDGAHVAKPQVKPWKGNPLLQD